MMTVSSLTDSLQRQPLWLYSLVVASVLFTFGFACALPFAGLAAFAALTFRRREALVATGAVWFANQAVGFGFLHYPTDSVTLAWGGALGVISLLSCEAAGSVTRRVEGKVGVGVAFLAAFIVYEGSLAAIDIATAQGLDHLTFDTVSRIFLINACAFGGLLALKALSSTATVRLAPRHV
jgi:hypothetical protein